MPVSDIDILKKLLSEEETETLRLTFEEDPMGFILNKYPGLNSVLEYMMTDGFREYLSAIFIVAPKPTTFKVVLHNGQHFFLQFMGKTYQATVLGKNYYLMNVGEKERCMIAIARLLRYGVPLKTKGPEGGEEAGGLGGELGGGETGGEETGGGEEAGGTEGGGEALEESSILFEILKKKLSLTEAPEDEEDPSEYILSVFKDHNPSTLEKKGSTKYEITIPSVKSGGAASREQRYDISKDVAQTNKGVTADKDRDGSPFVNITKNGVTYKVYLKGFTKDASNTDVKEGFAIMFYYSDIIDPITENNFQEVIEKLKKLTGVSGLAKKDTTAIEKYLNASSEYSKNIAETLNQSLSQGLAIRNAYPGLKVTRTGIFNDYKYLAKQVLDLDKDKWCPADLFVMIDEAAAAANLMQLEELAKGDVDQLEFTAKINGVFNNKFGDTIKPITGVSLKFEQAQLGKAKSYLDRQYSDLEDTYNVTPEEQKYTNKKILEKISEYRKNIRRIINKRTEKIQIEYILEDEKIEKDKIRGKFAGLKAINYWFTQVYNKYGANKIDNALVDITKFAMSLTTLNPTFFKVKAKKDGAAGQVIEFSQGVTMSLIKNKPIKIIDAPNYKGLKIMLPIKRTEAGAQELTTIQISAKSNGNTQGTIELEKGSKP